MLTIPGAVAVLPLGINNSETIIARVMWPTHGGIYPTDTYAALTLSDGRVIQHPIKGLESTDDPDAISSDGEIVGNVSVPRTQPHRVFWIDKGIRKVLPDVSGAEWNIPHGINCHKQIIGNCNIDVIPDPKSKVAKFEYSYLLEAGKYKRLAVPGAYVTYVSAVNDRGQIVGTCGDKLGNRQGFVYTHGIYHTFSDPNAAPSSTGRDRTVATGINENGDIVGIYISNEPSSRDLHFYLMRHGIFYDIPSPLGQPLGVRAVTNDCEIIGSVRMRDEDGRQGFILRPGLPSSSRRTM